MNTSLSFYISSKHGVQKLFPLGSLNDDNAENEVDKVGELEFEEECISSTLTNGVLSNNDIEILAFPYGNLSTNHEEDSLFSRQLSPHGISSSSSTSEVGELDNTVFISHPCYVSPPADCYNNEVPAEKVSLLYVRKSTF